MTTPFVPATTRPISEHSAIFEIRKSLSSGAQRRSSQFYIESPEHLRFRHVPEFPHQLEDRRLVPRTAVDLDGNVFRQNSRDVLEKTAAGDMRESFDSSGIEKRINRFQETRMPFEQCFADGRAKLLEIRVDLVSGDFEEQLPRERIPVCLQTFAGSPRRTSPGLIDFPSMTFGRSTTPTMKPARSYSPSA